MSEDPSLHRFVSEVLTDAGATVSGSGSLLWVQVPADLRPDLEVPSTMVMTLDPERVGEFDAELVAPGSYRLEKILSLAARRGRWDAARFEPPTSDWAVAALTESGFDPPSLVRAEVRDVLPSVLFEFSFRVTLISDEKREHLHRIAASPMTGSAWELDSASMEAGLFPASEAAFAAETIEVAYRLATDALRDRARSEVESFRSANLALLEEEVRRIFGYFDRSIEQIQKADPGGSRDLVHAFEDERDRRLAETLDRFDPKARASLCSVRAIVTPVARIRLHLPNEARIDMVIDAWSHHTAGVKCEFCHREEGPWQLLGPGHIQCARCASMQVESVRPRGRPPLDTPPPGRRDARGSVQSSRGPKARSRAASGRRRGR